VIRLHPQKVGPPYARRWVIRTNRDLFWNGESWSPCQEEALLFHVFEEANGVVNELMKALFESMTVWKFKAEVEVGVFGFIKPTLEDLKDHLWKTESLDLIFDDSGPETTIVLPTVSWDTLKEEG
jgi:hypothetical protein